MTSAQRRRHKAGNAIRLACVRAKLAAPAVPQVVHQPTPPPPPPSPPKAKTRPPLWLRVYSRLAQWWRRS